MIKPLDNYTIYDGPASVYKYNGYSLQELLSQFYAKIQEVIDGINNHTIDIKNFKEEVRKRLEEQDIKLEEMNEWLRGEGLQQEVVKQIELMYDDGRLSDLINEVIFGDLNKKIDNALSIVNYEIKNDFTKGTSFLCVDDKNVLDYLINDINTINIYKRCGIEVVLLTMTFEFDGTTMTSNASIPIISRASKLLNDNGIRVGIKIQDKATNLVNSENYTSWFSLKTNLMMEYLNVVDFPYSINIANEIPIMTSNKKYIPNFNLMYSTLKTNYPLMKVSVHTFFSDFYNGTFKMWDAVDEIGINYYPYTTNNAVPTYKEVKKAIYKPINGVAFFDTLNEIYKKRGKPFIISEWGTAGFEYQCKNPATDFIPTGDKVLNPKVQEIFMNGACELFPWIENCKGLYLWCSNAWRPDNTPFQRAWAWDLNPDTVNAIAKTWGDEENNEI